MQSDQDPFVMLAQDWVWSLYERAICAHERRDDQLALATLRFLSAIQAPMETEAKKRGLIRQTVTSFARPPAPSPFYFGVFEDVPLLLADQERRARNPQRSLQMPAGTDPNKRIAELIALLDEVSIPQLSQPGELDLRLDPIVQALVKEGEPAIEPLLKCVEEDTRLVRSISFHRDFKRSRGWHSVAEAAYSALTVILQSPVLTEDSMPVNILRDGLESRRALASQIRAEHQKFKGTSKEEQWYLVHRR